MHSNEQKHEQSQITAKKKHMNNKITTHIKSYNVGTQAHTVLSTYSNWMKHYKPPKTNFLVSSLKIPYYFNDFFDTSMLSYN